MKIKSFLFSVLVCLAPCIISAQQDTNDYVKIGYAKFEAGNVNGAMADLDKAAKLTPNNEKIFYLVAV